MARRILFARAAQLLGNGVVLPVFEAEERATPSGDSIYYTSYYTSDGKPVLLLFKPMVFTAVVEALANAGWATVRARCVDEAERIKCVAYFAEEPGPDQFIDVIATIDAQVAWFVTTSEPSGLTIASPADGLTLYRGPRALAARETDRRYAIVFGPGLKGPGARVRAAALCDLVLDDAGRRRTLLAVRLPREAEEVVEAVA